MISKLKNKNGMTLVELVIGMIVFAIITLAVVTVMMPMLRVYAESNDLAEINALVDSVGSQIVKDMTGMDSPLTPIAPSTTLVSPGASNVSFSTSIYSISYGTAPITGVFQQNGAPMFDERYYKQKTISVMFSQKSAADVGTAVVYDVTITITRRGEVNPMTTRVFTVKPPILNQ